MYNVFKKTRSVAFFVRLVVFLSQGHEAEGVKNILQKLNFFFKINFFQNPSHNDFTLNSIDFNILARRRLVFRIKVSIVFFD